MTVVDSKTKSKLTDVWDQKLNYVNDACYNFDGISNKNNSRNDLHIDLQSICSLNPWLQHDSSGRVYMTSSHLGQMLVVNGATERMCQTGSEREYGKYTFNVKMPCNGEIIEVIQRYPETIGIDTIHGNPQTIVIYEDTQTKELGMFSLTDHCSNHQYFGYKFKEKEGMQKLARGASIAKDTMFLDSPNVTDDGGYKYGVELQMALMTHPASSEDGILICEDVLPKFGIKTYEIRVVGWGSKKFALNTYGDTTNYKAFPDIGQRIRPDGIVMALRSYDPSLLAPIEQSVKTTMEVDLNFDTTVYANGPGGKVVDIKIHHDLNKMNCADVHMDRQAQKYDTARRHFYKRIVDVWRKFYKIRGDALLIKPELQRLVVEALSVVNEDSKQRVSKLYRKEPLDDYRVEITIEYDVIPGIGFKNTDIHGGKGIICQIGKPEDMPVDINGNRADIVMDPNSTVARMNLGRVYELYLNAASRDLYHNLCRDLGVIPGMREVLANNYLQKLDSSILDAAMDKLINYYRLISPKMYSWFVNGQVTQSKVDYLATIINRGVGLYLPPDNELESPDIIRDIEASIYKPTYGPVTYVGNSGRKVTTKANVRIGSMYFILLEKIGDDWASVSSGKLSHFGVLSQITKTDKFSKPARHQAVRGAGEAEVRIFSSYVGEHFTAELMDRNNNPKTHKMIVKNLLSHKTPTNVENLVDRKEIPFGGSKPINIINHVASVGGWKFKYRPYKPNWVR